jgi:RND family efflux transporter MFP subunit
MSACHWRHIAVAAVLCACAGANALAAENAAVAPSFEVTVEEIDDLKSVYATVRSKDLIEARVRTPGTIASLKVDEGNAVEPGQVLALVADPKIALRIKALDAQMVAIQSRAETAKTELERSQELKVRGVAPQSRVDQAQTAYDVAVNDLKSTRAERSVVETQIEEGQVLAPTAGRVLKVPVTEGSVVLAGESVATIAANEYLLRLELPERHARFIKAGDPVRIGGRGLGQDEGAPAEGRISQVYPELQSGRVVADAEVAGLGSYFVGERILVWISAGRRQAFLVPRAYVFKRFGLDYVRVAGKDGAPVDVIVQAGREDRSVDGKDRIEILAGVAQGDRLVAP